ncbi:MAG TPA: hypothetical protein VG389_13060 [Myxococcota bacterium]|jgi:hypothetical protein|nr:hypothetical protein [Myxococcota bacterium]
MFNDRITRWLLGAIGAALLVIGATVTYQAFAPEPANAADWYVELGAVCNADIAPPEKPWCAEVLSLGGGDTYALATTVF